MHIYLPVLPGLENWLNEQPDPIAILTEALMDARRKYTANRVNSHELVVRMDEPSQPEWVDDDGAWRDTKRYKK